MSFVGYANLPARDPDIHGVGRAWKVLAPDAPQWQQQASCGAWLVHAPHGHPFWTWYAVQCISLREIAGQDRPPHLQFPGASHEWLVLALNPEQPLPDIERWNGPGTPPMQYLEPIDQCVQFIVADDDQARELCELTVRHILSGVSPDQDFREYWRTAIANTAEHIRLGGHPDGPAHA